jgi:hypothetical protein
MLHHVSPRLLGLALLLPQIAGAANPPAPAKKAAKAAPAPKVPAGSPGKALHRPPTLNPVVPPASVHSEGPAYFELVRQGERWSLAFHTTDTHLKPQAVFIQILPIGGFSLEPGLIQSWPAGKTEIPLQAKGARPAATSWIQGGAAYQLCDDRKPGICPPARGTFSYRLDK